MFYALDSHLRPKESHECAYAADWLLVAALISVAVMAILAKSSSHLARLKNLGAGAYGLLAVSALLVVVNGITLKCRGPHIHAFAAYRTNPEEAGVQVLEGVPDLHNYLFTELITPRALGDEQLEHFIEPLNDWLHLFCRDRREQLEARLGVEGGWETIEIVDLNTQDPAHAPDFLLSWHDLLHEYRFSLVDNQLFEANEGFLQKEYPRSRFDRDDEFQFAKIAFSRPDIRRIHGTISFEEYIIELENAL